VTFIKIIITKSLCNGTKLQAHREMYKHDAKHPTIIPKDHHIAKLIIAHCYEKVKHQGKGPSSQMVTGSLGLTKE